jgi:hypothetical protein
VVKKVEWPVVVVLFKGRGSSTTDHENKAIGEFWLAAMLTFGFSMHVGSAIIPQ